MAVAVRTIPIDRLRFADFVRAEDVIAWPQGPGEPLALTAALVAQGADLAMPTLLFGLTQSDTLRPELGRHFRFRALNGAGNSRKVTDQAEIVPAHLSALPGLLAAYRRDFRPPRGREPRVTVSLDVLVADDDATARARILHGVPDEVA